MWKATCHGLRTAGTIVGRAVGEHGVLLADVKVWAADAPSLESLFRTEWALAHDSVSSDSQGGFRLDGVPEGTTRVCGYAADRRYSCSAPVAVVAGELPQEVVLTLLPLRPEVRIAGLVETPNGLPMHDRVRVRCLGYRNAQTFTDADGRFELRVPPSGLYRLQAEDSGGRWDPVLAENVAPGTLDLVLRFAN
jgi:hypothetical protein